MGTACNFTYGTCAATGDCIAILQHPNHAFCQGDGKEGQHCAQMSICKSQKCVHMCGSPDLACQCAPGSNNECHVCCLRNGRCLSIYDGTRSYLLQPVGTQCNFTYGTCDRYGICISLNTHPSAAFCRLFENDGVQCEYHHICRNYQCQHICNSPEKLCICPPWSNEECHICCLKSDGVCRSAYDGSSPFLLRPQGTSCNFTYGLCASNGQCSAVQNHPSKGICLGVDSNNLPCGMNMHCLDGQCVHVCGSPDRLCLCPPGEITECHTCCLDDNRMCHSIYSDNHPHLLRSTGTPCNYTFGTCQSDGTCGNLQVHPSQRLCDFIENEGNECGPQMACHNFRCEHICGNANRECRCPAEGADECHICCMAGESCRSIYDGKSKFRLQKFGSSCNYTQGTCNAKGVCVPVANFCAMEENDERPCRGSKFVCKNYACAHVCGKDENECICDVDSEDECHICCMSEGNCTSVRNENNKTDLVRPFGSACNFTMGVCSSDGFCQSIIGHPFYDILNPDSCGKLILNFFSFLFCLVMFILVACR